MVQVYQEYRNFMINKYREDQSRRLTFTLARTHLAGDVNGILRVWTFLDSWGLINFSAKTPSPADDLGPAPFQLAPQGTGQSPRYPHYFPHRTTACTFSVKGLLMFGAISLAVVVHGGS